MTDDHTQQNTPEAAPAAVAPTPKQWTDLGLSEVLLNQIKTVGFEKPTPVQGEAIPRAVQGVDLICSAQTGTGKTAAFVLPMIEKLKGREGTYGLILSPTREIALQTEAVLNLFAKPLGLRSVSLIGGTDVKQDARDLAEYPQIVVATPGRLVDHIERGNIWLEYIEMVVLDEADKMLDMGFAAQLNVIMDQVPKQRQTLLFSATIPPSVEALARKILHEPERIKIGINNQTAKTVLQRLWMIEERDKMRELQRLLKQEAGSIFVFTRSKDKATRVWRSLHSAGVYDATYLHSDRPQADREKALADFKAGTFRVLIATDVVGRGIDVVGVSHVVNFDLPYDPMDYVHRIGRTGRAEARGKATSFATREDTKLLRDIEKIIGRQIPRGDFEGEARPAVSTPTPALSPASGPAPRAESRGSREPRENRSGKPPGVDRAKSDVRDGGGGRSGARKGSRPPREPQPPRDPNKPQFKIVVPNSPKPPAPAAGDSGESGE